MSTLQIQSPEWSTRVFDPTHVGDKPVRYRIAYGGRGSSKSWEFARRLLVMSMQKKIRVLCTRELQNSIKDSVHYLLISQVEEMGLEGNFTWTDRSLKSTIGSEFIYKGMRFNSREIKSTEGVDIAWVEEAQSTSEESWEVLVPTIRKPGSEIWITFNPDQEEDPTYSRFVKNTPQNSCLALVNHVDNPWFPEELKAEMEYLRRVDYNAYLHVWEGQCRSYTDAQIFHGKWHVEPFEHHADWDGPYFGADWGFSQDPTVLIRSYIHNRTLYIENEVYGVGVDIDKTPAMFDTIENAKFHTIYADNARPETISYMQRNGYPRIKSCKKWAGSVEDGIAHIRGYDRIVIHPRCVHMASEARLYSYKMDRLTGDILAKIDDKHNHCWDAVRYALGPLITAAKSFTETRMSGFY